jgi:hypothetical protein
VEGPAAGEDGDAIFLEDLARTAGIVLLLLRVHERAAGDPVSLGHSPNYLK